jgi:hypothetical protein
MGATTNSYITITPAEGFDVLPTNLIDKLAYETDSGYIISFDLGVPCSWNYRMKVSQDEFVGRLWGGYDSFETYEISVADNKITAGFENKEDAPTPWVKNLSKKFPTAVFHLSFVNTYWNYGGEVTAQAGVVSNEITEDTATAARARATHMPDMTEDDFLGWEAQDTYVTLFPERSSVGNPNEGWIKHILEIGAEKINPLRADELTRVLTTKLTEFEQWEAEREARING